MRPVISAIVGSIGSMARASGRRNAFNGEIPTYGYQAHTALAKPPYDDGRDRERRQADRKAARKRTMRLRVRRGRGMS